MYYRIFICSFSEDHWLISSIKNSASEYLSVFEILGLFSRMPGPFTHQQCMSDPVFSAPLPELGIVSTFSFSLYDRRGVLSHCVSNLHSLTAIDVEHLLIYLFICFYPYYISSLVKCLC